MNKIGFVINLEKDPFLEYTKKLKDFVLNLGYQIVVLEKFRDVLGLEYGVSDLDAVCRESDFVTVLGGDGTILTVARRACIYQTPILGINLGTLGYLADVEKNGAFRAVEKVLNNDYSIEKRMMLEIFKDGKTFENCRGLALNEVCLKNNTFSRMIKFDIEINDEFIDSYRADGVIISTPTGSTAYNLAAGGPILKPDTELISITHLCPHTLYARPYVVSGSDIIKLKIKNNEKNVMLFLDGHEVVSAEGESEIIIKRSKFFTRIIKTTGLGFYDILRRKMVEIRK